MKARMFGSVAALLAGSGLVLAEGRATILSIARDDKVPAAQGKDLPGETDSSLPEAVASFPRRSLGIAGAARLPAVRAKGASQEDETNSTGAAASPAPARKPLLVAKEDRAPAAPEKTLPQPERKPPSDASPSGPANPVPSLSRKSLAGSINEPAVVTTAEPPSLSQVWAGGEYLLWWTKGSRLPPLVTAGPTNAAVPGALGQPGTVVLFGGDVDEKPRSGGRFTAGVWLDSCQTIGVEGTYLFLAQRSFNFAAGPGALQVLAIPFFDPTTAMESSLVVNGPAITTVAPGRLPNPFIAIVGPTVTVTTGVPTGNVAASFSSRLAGGEGNLIWNLTPPGDTTGYHLELLGGFRHLELREQLGLQANVTTTGTAATFFVGGLAPLVTATFTAVDNRTDDFDVRDQFYGGQIGVRGGYSWGKWSVDAATKVALGDTREEADILGTHTASFSGLTAATVGAPVPVVFQQSLLGGVFAQPSNIGRYARNEFAVIPEVTASAGYRITEWLKASVGYNFLYWSNVARVGTSMDRVINPAFLAPTGFPLAATTGEPLPGPGGPARPAFAFHDSSFWAQGIEFVLEFTY